MVFTPSPREGVRLVVLDCERLVLGIDIVIKRAVLLVPKGVAPY